MRFKEWLQQEISLDLTTPTSTTPNSTMMAKATATSAKNTMAKFGPQIVKDMSRASTPKTALQQATTYAQKDMKQGVTNPTQTPTNVGQVGAQVYKMATGKEPKTI